MSFDTIFWDVNYENKLLNGPKQVFFSQLKTNFHPKITSQNIVRKGHEQVYRVQSGIDTHK